MVISAFIWAFAMICVCVMKFVNEDLVIFQTMWGLIIGWLFTAFMIGRIL